MSVYKMSKAEEKRALEGLPRVRKEEAIMEGVIEAACSSCGKKFLFAGTVEQVPDDLCLDCFVEKHGEEEVESELAEVVALAGEEMNG